MATIVYAAPHQDDETLSMGASIRAHLEAGHDVHTLLLTTGENSGARAATGLDKPAFVVARTDEFTRASRRLGVPFRNIHTIGGAPADGQLTFEAAADMLRAVLAELPGAWLKTYSQLLGPGRHADHLAAGQAAVTLLRSGEVTNLRLYIEPWLLGDWRAANPGVGVSVDRARTPAVVVAALDEYGQRDAVGGKYGIGHASVPSAFATVRADPVSTYHLPPA